LNYGFRGGGGILSGCGVSNNQGGALETRVGGIQEHWRILKENPSNHDICSRIQIRNYYDPSECPGVAILRREGT